MAVKSLDKIEIEDIKNENLKILIKDLIEDKFILDDEKYGVCLCYDEEDLYEDFLFLFDDIHIMMPTAHSRLLEQFDKDTFLLSFRLDCNPYNIATFMESLVGTGLSYFLGEGFVKTDDDDIKLENMMNDKDWEVINHMYIAEDEKEK